jgi:hypothetical protein
LKQKREEEENQHANGNGNDAEATQTNDDEPPPPPLSETPVPPDSKKRLMPGLLSTRMQQEWVRYEEENPDKKQYQLVCPSFHTNSYVEST